MRYLLLFFAFLTLLPSDVVLGQSYTIMGRVTDSQLSPLKEVNVKVLNTETGTLTDEHGFFRLRTNLYQFKVSFSHIGYSTVVISRGSSTDCLFVILTEETQQLSEVVISSDHKEKSLLSAPASITALTSDKISQMKIWSLEDLTGLVPNFSYAELGVGYQQQIGVRGISIFSETPATATYIDGVASLDVNATGLQLMDIERIEVMRGPHGTMYGRNAMAGVISITTKKNSETRRAFVEVSTGNQGLQRYGLGLRMPLVKNKFSFGFAGQYQKRHGFYTNDLSDATTIHPETKERYSLRGTPEDGVRVGDEESLYGNLSFKFTPSSNLSFSWDNILQKEHSLGASAYYMAVPSNITALQKPYKFQVNDLGSHARTYINSSLNAIYHHARFSFTSTSALQYISQSYHRIDQDLLPDNAAYGSTFRTKTGDPFPQNVLSQEFRVRSSGETRLNWIAGAYFFRQVNQKQYATVYKDLAALLGMREGSQVSKTHIDNVGASVYGQADYKLTRRLKATAGLRADRERRTIEVARYYLAPDGSRDYDIADTVMNSRFSSLSPKVILQYLFSDSRQVYLSYGRGFRAGGNNLFSRGKYFSYDPEYSNNFEIGYKFQTRDKRLRMSAVLFYLFWMNMQLDLNPEPGYWIVDNVGNVKSYGVEAEVTTIPLPGMLVDLSLGMNNASYGSFDYLGKNISGNKAILSPESTAMIGLQQLFPLSTQTGVTLRAEWKRTGSQYFDLVNEIHQPAYQVFNSRIAFQYKKTELAFWGQNLNGARFLTFAMPGYFKHSVINRPRTWGVSLKHSI